MAQAEYDLISITTSAQASGMESNLQKLVRVPIAFSSHYFALGVNVNQVLIYKLEEPIYSFVRDILERPTLTKFYGTHPGKLNQLARLVGASPASTMHTGAYVQTHLKPADLAQLKDGLIEAGIIPEEDERLAQTVLTLGSYLMKIHRLPPKNRFNKVRDCYLVTLTVYNDILTQYGPLIFTDLVAKARTYPNLCRISRSHGEILEGLIRLGALLSDPITAKVSLPDPIK